MGQKGLKFAFLAKNSFFFSGIGDTPLSGKSLSPKKLIEMGGTASLYSKAICWSMGP